MKTATQLFPMMQKAVARHQAGQFLGAEEAYLEVLGSDASHIDALRLLGGLYIQHNHYDRAAKYLEKAVGLKPGDPEIANNLGIALYHQGKFDEALSCYQKAVQLKPDYYEAINNLGNLFYERRRLDDAIPWLTQSLHMKQENAQAQRYLGNAFQAQGKWQQAIPHYEQALRLEPDDVDTLISLGNLLRDAGRVDEACILYQRIVDLKPDSVNARLNLGTLFHDVGKLDEALEHYQNVLRLQPDSFDAVLNHGSLLMGFDRPEEAKASYDQALRLRINSPDAKWGKALALLALGEYREGWTLYESGLERKNTRGPIPFPFRAERWDGGAFPGKRLLIWGEQGLGDVLQFVRYAALCKERGGKVLVLCRKPLARLLKNCPFIDEVVTTVSESDFDFYIPVMSLPHIFGTTLETIPAEIPYLYVSEDARKKWAPRFAGAEGFKVGLVWAGSPRKRQIDAHLIDRRRSMSLDWMRPLFAFDQIAFYNLQIGDASAQIDACGLRDRIIDYTPDVEDLMDTAAIIENLDLVISVDTSVVHLAGGLGKPVWVLSRFDGCWRWLRNREASPWYPTARVFGQPTPGDWDTVVDRVRDALGQWSASSKL